MKKKVLAATLATTLTISMLAGCGNNGNSVTDTTAASTAEGTKESTVQGNESSQADLQENLASNGLPLDYYAGTTLNIYTKPGSTTDTSVPEDKLIYKLAEEATGIHINWTILSTEAWSERVNLMLSSGEMPDAFLGSVGQSTISSNMDMFYDLSEEGLLETYAPDVLATIEETYTNGVATCS